jgi:hypothetical protein
MLAEVSMKPIIFAVLITTLVVVASGSVAQAQPSLSNPAEQIRTPESGPPMLPRGDATTGPNSRNQSVDPLPGSRDDLKLRPDEAQLPVPEVRPITGSPLAPAKKR